MTTTNRPRPLNDDFRFAPLDVQVRYWRYRLIQTATRRAAHLLPPRVKLLAAIDLLAGVAPNDATTVGAMEAVKRYGDRHGVR